MIRIFQIHKDKTYTRNLNRFSFRKYSDSSMHISDSHIYAVIINTSVKICFCCQIYKHSSSTELALVLGFSLFLPATEFYILPASRLSAELYLTINKTAIEHKTRWLVFEKKITPSSLYQCSAEVTTVCFASRWKTFVFSDYSDQLY